MDSPLYLVLNVPLVVAENIVCCCFTSLTKSFKLRMCQMPMTLLPPTASLLPLADSASTCNCSASSWLLPILPTPSRPPSTLSPGWPPMKQTDYAMPLRQYFLTRLAVYTMSLNFLPSPVKSLRYQSPQPSQPHFVSLMLSERQGHYSSDLSLLWLPTTQRIIDK